MIIGLIAGVAGFFAGVTSTDTVNIAKSSEDKNKAAGGAAGAFLTAGICVLAATSWACAKIIHRYNSMWGGGNVGGQPGIAGVSY